MIVEFNHIIDTMYLSIIAIISLISSVAASGVSIPLSIDSISRQIFVNITVTNSTGSRNQVSIPLSPGPLTSLPFDDINELHFTNGDFFLPFVPFRSTFIEGNFQYYLGIGSSSPLVAEYESVSVIKNYENTDAQLILGLSSEDFESQFCEPGSLILLEGRHRWSIRQSMGDSGSEIRQVDLMHSPTIPGAVTSVSPSFYARISESILSQGGREDVLLGRYVNCGRSILDYLPAIYIEFIAQGYSWRASLDDEFGIEDDDIDQAGLRPNRMMLSPEDYMLFDDTMGICTILVVSSPFNRTMFNSVALTGINTRTTEDSYEICDSSL